MDNSPWLTTPEAGFYARRHPKTVLRALRTGELRGHQAKANGTWRIHRDDVDAWLRGEKPSRRKVAS